MPRPKSNWSTKTAPQPGTGNVSPLTTALFIFRPSFPCPSHRAEAARYAGLISLVPISGLLFEAVAEDLLDGDMLAALDPLVDQRLPSVLIITLLLLLRGRRTQLSRIDPPSFTSSKTGDGFCPKLVSIATEVVDTDVFASYRPEAPA